MNTTASHTNGAPNGAPARHRWVHGTNPWQGASMVLSAALLGGVPAAGSRHAVGRLVPSASFDAAIALYERGEWEPAFDDFSARLHLRRRVAPGGIRLFAPHAPRLAIACVTICRPQPDSHTSPASVGNALNIL